MHHSSEFEKNPSQKMAIAHLSGPMMVLAGPGSGKTSVIVERIAYVYLNNGEGEGTFLTKTEFQKDRLIKEYLGFLYFDYNMLPKTDKKKKIIKTIKEYNKSSSKIQLSFINISLW